jgi:Arc/MetJ-type ribon-helix-helix transcriptional regulator
VKTSISLKAADLEFLDAETEQGHYPSRSAAVAAGISLLRAQRLTDSYAEAFEEWAASGDADAWETAASDGLTDHR